MAQVGDVQVCVEVDVDNVCTATAWMPHASALPPMSHADAAPIIAAIVGLWGLAFAVRQMWRMTNAGGG